MEDLRRLLQEAQRGSESDKPADVSALATRSSTCMQVQWLTVRHAGPPSPLYWPDGDRCAGIMWTRACCEARCQYCQTAQAQAWVTMAA